MRISDWSSDVCSSDLLSKTFGAGEEAVHALDDVSLAIRENEFFTLLGPSGCGKTTLLRLIGGFEQPSAGDIFLHGRQLTGLPPFKRPINTVFKRYALLHPPDGRREHSLRSGDRKSTRLHSRH